jgi:hypothetical protein
MAFSFGFGGKAKKSSTIESGKSRFETSGTETRQLELDQLAIEKIIADVLGGPQGLASIFGGEQTAGIFNSSVSAQASGDIVANLVGEIAKLTGKEVVTSEESGTEAFRNKSSSKEASASADFTI